MVNRYVMLFAGSGTEEPARRAGAQSIKYRYIIFDSNKVRSGL